MNSTKLMDAELVGARLRKAADTQRRKEAARRAYEGGEMTVAEIAAHVRADPDTVKRWRKEGRWERKP